MKKSVMSYLLILLLSFFLFSPIIVGAETDPSELSTNNEAIDSDPGSEVEEVLDTSTYEEPSLNQENDSPNEEKELEEPRNIEQSEETENPANIEKDEVVEGEETTEKQPNPELKKEVMEDSEEKKLDESSEKESKVKIQTESFDENKLKELKSSLIKLGFLDSDKETLEGIKKFQQYYGLNVTGEMDEQTIDTLEEVLSSPFQKGKRHNDSIKLKEYLNTLGFSSFKNPTVYYGTQTEEAVKEFQKVNGLPVSGIADQNTRNELKKQATGYLKKGMYRADAIPLKEKLVQLGFASFKNPNNYYGSQTEKGVMAFQDYYGLEKSGIAGQATLAKVEEILSSPFQRGKRHEGSVSIKQNLVTLGYASFKNPTTLFGVQTEAAVKAFQKAYNLPISGIVDPKTLELLDKEANAPLEKGMRRNDAIELKENLVLLGFVSFKNPNNYFGKQTEKAVKDFQSYYGLTQNGKADEATLTRMNEILSSPFQSGKRHDGTVVLKENLVILGYADFKNPTTYYGSQTAKAVKEFQKDNGLPVSGIAEHKTLELLNKIANTPLEKGMRRNDAIELKENLVRLGFASFKNPNNYYGPQTERAVRDFQSHFGLAATGVADQKTIQKVNEIVSSPYQKGKRHKNSISMKRDLVLLGYANFKNPNNLYGSSTEKAVKAFQKDHQLPVSGIADPITREKIKKEASKFMRNGTRNSDVIQLKKDLNRLGFSSFKNPTTYFGTKTEKAVRDFQKHYGLSANGIADDRTLREMDKILSSPLQKGKRHKDAKPLKEDLVLLGYASFKNPNNYYGSQTERAVKQFQRDKGLPISGIADKVTLRKIDESFVKVFLDPGHGGKDSGAPGFGLMEKDIVLDIAHHAADTLVNQYKGVKVKLSRSDDTFVELLDRSKMANQWGADLFISIHTNAFNGNAKGFESFIHNGKVSNKNKEIQKDIHQYLINKINRSNRGMKTANFSVLRNTNMSSVLIEYLFIDNYSDNLYLRNSNNRKNLGKWTADAIAETLNIGKGSEKDKGKRLFVHLYLFLHLIYYLPQKIMTESVEILQVLSDTR